MSIDTNLKIACVGNFDQGVELVRVDPPRVEIVQDTDENGELAALFCGPLPGRPPG